jgi:peptidoglycan/LPS O-acetylase OafA/YrhL
MTTAVREQPEANPTAKPGRLHYLDALRVLAMLMVFLFHAVHPYDASDWHVKNNELSVALTIVMSFVFTWGMPFFFLLAGASNWFSLQNRAPGSYVRERLNRLFVPYVIAALIFTPVQIYVEWSHQTATGAWQMTFAERLSMIKLYTNPRIFGELGYHLWFIGFLLAFSLLTLPLLRWLKSPSGTRLIERMAAFCQRRGAILLFMIPLIAIRLGLHPFFPEEHNWSDFFVLMAFFILGYILFADPRFTQAVRRDMWLFVMVGLIATVIGTPMALSVESFDIETPPGTLFDFALWALIMVNSWTWTLFALALGIRFLNAPRRWVDYGQESVLPIYVVHQPIILVLAYFIVQWDASLIVKMVATVISSFLVAFGLYEAVIRPFAPMRALFGMKPRRPEQAQAHTTTPGHVGA